MTTAPDHFAVIRAAGQAQLKLLAEHVIDTISRSDALIDDVIDTLPDTLEDADLANVGMIDEDAPYPEYVRRVVDRVTNRFEDAQWETEYV